MAPRPKFQTDCTSIDSSFSFRSKHQFDATQTLIRSRSDCFLESKRKLDKDRLQREREASTIWDIQPPDFRLQLYQPKPKKRNTKESMIPNYDEDEWRKRQAAKRKDNIKFERIPLPKILQETRSELDPFVTKFDIQDTYKANVLFVKEGKFHHGPYANPAPHTFRPDDFTALIKKYGVPDFKSSYPRDPQGLITKSKGLRVLCESYKDLQSTKPDGFRKQLITYRPHDPDWDVTLILPTGAYKKGHSANSALMKGIERQLPWCPDREKLEPIMRPDIHDNKTVDWIAVTGHPMNECTRL